MCYKALSYQALVFLLNSLEQHIFCVCFHHAAYGIWVNLHSAVKELVAQNMHNIWNSGDCNYNQSVCKTGWMAGCLLTNWVVVGLILLQSLKWLLALQVLSPFLFNSCFPFNFQLETLLFSTLCKKEKTGTLSIFCNLVSLI